MEFLYIYNLGQTIVDKITKLSKMGFFMESFTAVFFFVFFVCFFLAFSNTNVKFSFLGSQLFSRHQIQAFQALSLNS